MQRMICVVLVSALMLGSTGCALILSGTNQNVEMAIRPQNSKVEVRRWDGKIVALAEDASNGQKLKMKRPKRGQSYVVVASAEGRCPQYWLTKGVINPLKAWDALVVLLAPPLGLIFMIVDTSSLAQWKVTPERFKAELPEASRCGI